MDTSFPIILTENSKGEGILLYIREHIPSKIIILKSLDESFESLFVEIKTQNKKLSFNVFSKSPQK